MLGTRFELGLSFIVPARTCSSESARAGVFTCTSPTAPTLIARIERLGAIGAVRALEGSGVAVLPRYFVDKDLREGLSLLMPRTKLATDWFRLVWRDGHPYEARLRELAANLASLPLREPSHVFVACGLEAPRARSNGSTAREPQAVVVSAA